jgi:hypothetical protein
MPERGWRWLLNFVDSFYPAWQQQQQSGGSLHGTCFPGFFEGFAATSTVAAAGVEGLFWQ